MTEKETIFKNLKQNPEHILCELTKDNFKLAKAFFGEERITLEEREKNDNDEGYVCEGAFAKCYFLRWQYHIQQLALAEDRLKYLSEYV